MVADALLQAAAVLLSLQAIGTALFAAVFARLLNLSRTQLVRGGMWLTTGALLLLCATAAFEPARLAGDLSGMTEPALYRMLLFSGLGAAYGLRVAGLLINFLALRLAARAVRANDALLRTAVAGATLVTVAAFTLSGHTVTAIHPALTGALLAAHLLIIAFWLGSLWPLTQVVHHEPAPQALRIVRQFSQLALGCVPFIAVAGVLLASLLLPDWAALTQPYGLLLLSKLLLFLILMLCAAINKARLGPGATRDASGALRFQRMVWLEYLLIGVVVLLTLIMTTFYSPGNA